MDVLKGALFIDALVEAERNGRKARDIARPAREVERGAQRHFAAQRSDLLPRLDRAVSIHFTEALQDDFERTWSAAVSAVSSAFAGVVQSVSERAMAMGFTSGALDLGVDLSFSLNHPASMEFLRDRGARRVAMIDDASREMLQRVLVDSRERSLSWGQTSRRISDEFGDFSRQRANLIAVTETSEAYERGRLATAESLEADGLRVEKRWLLLGANPCPVCTPNAGAGWIPRGEAFPSGHESPLAHPRCACDTELRTI